MYRGGLRCNEALLLKSKDLNSKQGTIRVLNGKGKKARLIGLDAGAFAIIERWVEKRKTLGISGHRPLFCTLDGKPLQSAYVRNLLKRLAKKAGIEKRVHAHGLRHTHAFELANEGTPLHVIQQQLGHASLATTENYIKHLNAMEVVVAMQNRQWSL